MHVGVRTLLCSLHAAAQYSWTLFLVRMKGRARTNVTHMNRRRNAARFLTPLALLVVLLLACGTPRTDSADATYMVQRATFVAQQATATEEALTPFATTVPSPAATTPLTDAPATQTVAMQETSSATPDRPTPTRSVAASTPTEVQPASTEPAPTLTATTPPPPTSVRSVESGFGPWVTDVLELEAGPVVVTLSHDGSGPFVVDLIDINGLLVGRAVAATGSWIGSRVIMIPEDGQYYFDVLADDTWQVEVMRPSIEGSINSALPFRYQGTGSQAVYYVTVDPGTYTLTAGSDGASEFVVTVMTSEGGDRAILIDHVGLYFGSVTFTIEGGGHSPVYLMIDIVADGNWEISIT
jgi:hypothetical protein